MSTGSSETMKAIQYYSEGGPEVLVYEDVPRPTAGPSEVLIRIYAAGVNPADWRARAGFPDVPEKFRYAIPHISLPSIPGFDVSGIVEAIGADVSEFREGDAVIGMVRFPQGGRGYAEYTIAPVTDLARKPAAIDHLQAAAIPMAALTAWQMLYQDLEAGQTVLVNGAAGGVGHFAVQLAKVKGAHVIGAASGGHAAFLRELGVDECIDYTVTPVEQVVHDIDVVFDTVGGDNNRLLSVLKRGGRFVPVNAGNYSAERASEAGITIGTSHHRALQSSGVQLAEIGKLIDTGQVQVAIDTIVPLAEAYKAHERGEAGHVRGKIVLRVVE
jgi:NADPH:quinone reductase-like Zn-dependent oxidoreductase